MRIAMLSSLSNELEKNTGGVSRVTIELARAFKKYYTEIDLTIVSLSPSVSEIIEKKTEFGSLCFIPTNEHGRTMTLYAMDIRRILKYLRSNNFDIVHSQAFPELILAGQLSGLPHVATIHGIISKEAKMYHGNLRMRIREEIRGVIGKYIIARLEHLISISSYVEENVQGLSSTRIYQINNPISEEFFEPSSHPFKGKILQVGSVVPRKGAHVLIESANLLKLAKCDFEVNIIGSLDNKDYFQHLSSLISVFSLSDNVRIHGPLGDSELLKFYREADIITLCSFEETSPLSLAQGMACGRIVVGSRSSGIPALIQEGVNGFMFGEGSASELAKVIKDILEKPSVYESIGLQARKSAILRFHPKTVIEQTLQIYKSILTK